MNQRPTAMLHRLYAVFQDYHQALGYVASFLSLTIDEETVVKVYIHIYTISVYIQYVEMSRIWNFFNILYHGWMVHEKRF